MRTITESMLMMVVSAIAVALSIIAICTSIFAQEWWFVAANVLICGINVHYVRTTYIRAKRIEEEMQSDIESLKKFVLFEIVRKTFEQHQELTKDDLTPSEN